MVAKVEPDGVLVIRVIWLRDFEDNWSPYGWTLIATDPQDEADLVKWHLERTES